MFKKTLRFMMLCALLIAALPVLAQGDKDPAPTPAATKGGQNTTGPSATTQPAAVIRQWATAAVASSEYTATDWGALQATGAPDSFGCTDQVTAWASLEPADGEYIILLYDQPVIPTQINIHVSLNPGLITGVFVGDSFNEGDDAITEIPNSAQPRNAPCPGVHTVNISGIGAPMDSVIVQVDQARAGAWIEIDAVELVGIPVGSTGPSGPSGPTTRLTATPQPPANVEGILVSCPNGMTFNNGSEVVVNMRPGFSYTATAIGIGSFDPIIAVIDEEGTTLCNDDSANAATYIANLPTTGPIGPSPLTAHMPFTYSGDELGNVSFVVGSGSGAAGEFLLLVEGLAVTRSDGSGEGAGDPFVVVVSPNMIASGVPQTAYMVAVTSALDTMISTVDLDGRYIRLDDGTSVICDDAGRTNCFGFSEDLTPYYVSRENGRTLAGGQFDSMLSIPADVFTIEEGGILNFRFTSSSQATLGDYVAAFHFGTAATAVGSDER